MLHQTADPLSCCFRKAMLTIWVEKGVSTIGCPQGVIIVGAIGTLGSKEKNDATKLPSVLDKNKRKKKLD